MFEVIGVLFKNNGRVYYFSPQNMEIKKGMNLIVETERGLQYGTSTTNIMKIEKSKIGSTLKNVIRIATKEDEKKYQNNLEESNAAYKECLKLISINKLKMNLVDASFTFDKKQLIFHFTSDDRVDFRKLAKDLASLYKTRIELRQVGVRDKAKEIGGLGPCGRPLCCSTFLENFETVSINMAKNQNLSLNPNKINGSCGRLLCCLNYENETYEEHKKELPQIGEIQTINRKKARVIDLNILAKSYKVVYENNDIEKINL